ncbi:MAG: imidazole glycerol phosphate synthase subunit HisF [Archangium sp.]|nr:imidazole glycerol phosphate synthase subunit HisF [Archangium sp.]
MLRRRVIPSLLLSGSGLVKTRKFRKPVYVGDPINAVKIFNEKEVDELFLIDIHASRERRGPNFALVESIVSEAFMPVAYSGGVRSYEDVRTLLRLGVEKVALNTTALDDLKLVRELSNAFGVQCIVGVVDVKRDFFGRAKVWSHAGRTPHETDPRRWMQALVEAGAGELLVQSVDRDGTLDGLDLDLLASLKGAVNVPVVAAGGARDERDLKAAFDLGYGAVAVGAKFVFIGPHRAVLISYLSDAERLALQLT